MPTNSESTSGQSADRLMSVNEVAAMLGCSARSVWKLRTLGKLRAVQLPGTTMIRFKLSNVRAIITEGEGASLIGGAAAVK